MANPKSAKGQRPRKRAERETEASKGRAGEAGGQEGAGAGRCAWAKNELAVAYHDAEWGVPCRDDRTLFEFLILEGAQAGLSWDTILKKRARYREVFEGFEAERVARFTPARVEKLMGDAGIVRHRGKIESAVTNARAFLEVRGEFGSFAAFVWGFTEVGGRAKAGEPIVNRVRSIREVPARTAESDAMSKALKKRGFKFVGSTICYAYMQAVGMVNDHEVTCPRWRAVQKSAR